MVAVMVLDESADVGLGEGDLGEDLVGAAVEDRARALGRIEPDSRISGTANYIETGHGHVQFESLLEREYLLASDATVDVVAITAQPLALLWPHGSPGERNHVPDFFVRLTSGDGRP